MESWTHWTGGGGGLPLGRNEARLWHHVCRIAFAQTNSFPFSHFTLLTFDSATN